jgi:endo-1,4-beta-D-glucanase Y
MGRLQAEFNVSAEQVREYAGIKPVSMKDSIKMRVALKAMQTFAQKKKDVELKPGTQKDLHKEYWK